MNWLNEWCILHWLEEKQKEIGNECSKTFVEKMKLYHLILNLYKNFIVKLNANKEENIQNLHDKKLHVLFILHTSVTYFWKENIYIPAHTWCECHRNVSGDKSDTEPLTKYRHMPIWSRGENEDWPSIFLITVACVMWKLGCTDDCIFCKQILMV